MPTLHKQQRYIHFAIVVPTKNEPFAGSIYRKAIRWNGRHVETSVHFHATIANTEGVTASPLRR